MNAMVQSIASLMRPFHEASRSACSSRADAEQGQVRVDPADGLADQGHGGGRVAGRPGQEESRPRGGSARDGR